MGKANRFLPQARRLELYEQTMRELTTRTAQHVTEIAALQERVRDLEKDVTSLKHARAVAGSDRGWLIQAVTGSWRERREARRALR